MIGYMCTIWWLLFFLYHCFPATLPGLQVPESPGTRLKREGLTAQHPVVLVPGFITGGLELWEGKPCAEGLFRKRLWGGSFSEMLKRPLCLLDHLILHNETGLDPPGVRVRAVQGLAAADYFAPGYFVWALLIENLAQIGYEEKNLFMAAYDWRLSFQNTEIRDQALSKLKSVIELMYVTNGYKKVVAVPHSMGAMYFLLVVCSRAYYLVCILACPLVITWDSTISLLPKGGENIWSNLDWFPEVGQVCVLSNNISSQNSVMITEFFGSHTNKNSESSCGEVWTEYDVINRESIRKFAENKDFTVATIFDLLRFVAPKMMQRAESQFSHEIADDLDPKYEHYRYWLPDAPDMEIYCSYGVGVPTERSYVLKVSPIDRCKSIPFRIDTSVDGEEGSCLKSGVHLVDGEESVPALSAAVMCAKGWKGSTRFNPSSSPTCIREYQHKPSTSLLEGRSTESGSHVEILGNDAFIEDLLRVAAGATGAEIGGDRIHSDILKMSEKINLQL
ncbi:hypothetical protein P3X46_000114 [Hevea brasiliensis]|uniref:Uncharacterized protein n=1 Tax=Hevea brasiliensis TaxID=3981 RepID=A0ABQ9N8K4_HEVBR|nr:hypothetical protein P3X46_000114 [Hevea brasiliensis]